MSLFQKSAWDTWRCGPPRVYGHLTYYACEGLIVVEDSRDGSTTQIKPDDFELRAQMLGYSASRTKFGWLAWERPEKARQRAAANQMLECVKEARDMGDPSDQRVQEHRMRHRRSQAVSLAPRTDAQGYAGLPAMPQGKGAANYVQPDHILLPGGGKHAVYRPPERRTTILTAN